MALPWNFTVTCKSIDPWPGTGVATPSEYARITFVKATAETADDELMDGEQEGETLELRVHQAQKDDFTVGNDYTLALS